MPKLGQAMEYGTVVEWLVADGAMVRTGDPVASVDTDKATFEIEAAESGVIRHLAALGDEIPVGEPFATIGEAADAGAAGRPSSPSRERPLASPRAKGLARSLSLDIGEVSPHRVDGLIVAADVEAAVEARKAAAATQGAAAGEILLTRLQKASAERLARSWSQAPHIVQMVEVNAGPLAEAAAALREGAVRVTLNDLLIKAAADCLAQNPALNVRFASDRLIPRPDVGIGLAVATDAGLTVPVVRGADRLGLAEISARTRELIAAARAGRRGAGEIGGAGLTISNLGAYGIAFGTPVLNLDEAILVFVGAIEDRPIVQGGRIVAGRRTTLSIAYDHRIVDGLAAARFSQALKARLERIDHLAPTAAPPRAARLAEREIEAVSAADGLRVDVRSARHAWTIDEPLSAGGSDAGPDPVALVLGALASCLVIAFRLAARRRQVPVDEVRAHLSANPSGRVSEAALRLEVWSAAPEAEVRKLLAPAEASCLVQDLLRPDLPLALDLVVHPARP
jgi:pyruvate/2-oxoglutarate dehydrogenase complex dihydrolipoamide acyltransferase (E2) component/uncharacterized OsmC-like protein